jgi:hypothetical protein
MTLVDEAVSSENLLQLLEYLDKILEIYGTTRKNERTATIALFHSLCPLCLACGEKHKKSALEEVIVMRDMRVDTETHDKLFGKLPLGRKMTEFDLFFLNVPTIIGHSSKGKMNFYVEIEMGKDVSPELQNTKRLQNYFREMGLDVYPILVCSQYKGWDSTFDMPILSIRDLEKMIELIPVRSLADIPGVAYEWAATCLQILRHVALHRQVDPNRMINYKSGLWDSYPHLIQHNFRKFVENGRISTEHCEEFMYFRQRMTSISKKMIEKGLLNMNERRKYELSIDGRDILGCYLSFKEGN